MNTGVGAMALYDLQKAVAVQRQYDPAFDAKIEALGHSPALQFLGYMLPATPWSIPASFPAWARDLAAQGLRNDRAAGNGGVISDTDFITPITKVGDLMNPFNKRVQWLGRGLDELGEGLPWNQQPEQGNVYAPGAKDALGNPLGGSPSGADLSQPTSPGDLQSAVQPATGDLQESLQGPFDALKGLFGP